MSAALALTNDVDLHTNANNFAPNEYREVVNLFGFAVYNDIEIVRLKGKVNIKCEGVNYGGNMDRGAMTFTSDVSIPKDDKQLYWVNKLQLGN